MTFVSDTDYCASNQCVHGECVSTKTGYTCSCNGGYSGERCDLGKTCSLFIHVLQVKKSVLFTVFYLNILHVISCHIISYHISYHIISYHISYHIISYIISYHIISYIISYHIILHYITLLYTTVHYIKLHFAMCVIVTGILLSLW